MNILCDELFVNTFTFLLTILKSIMKRAIYNLSVVITLRPRLVSGTGISLEK